LELGIAELSYYHLIGASDGWRALARLCLTELLLFGPVLAAVVLASRSRTRCSSAA
jgi:hypothetical protein